MAKISYALYDYQTNKNLFFVLFFFLDLNMKFPKKLIIGSSLHQNNRVIMLITKLFEDIK